MKKRTIAGIVFAVILIIIAVLLLPAIAASPDTIDTSEVPESCQICSDFSFEKQEENESAAYAAAFVMRWLGKNTNGSNLTEDVKYYFDTATPRSVVQLFHHHGLVAIAHHGSLDTLRQRVCEGTPAIVLLNESGELHYTVVTGYDAEYFYLADSDPQKATTVHPYYNRKISVDEFQKMWKTNTLIPNNAYIIADKKR